MPPTDRRSTTAVPPPPPTRRARLRAWLRRRDRAGQRTRLLVLGGVLGLLAGGIVALAAAALLQPRFTVLELSAQRLAPRDPSAQPPQERVGPYAAFDRRYVVDVATPDDGLASIVDRARSERWRVVRRGPREVALERGGVAAAVSVHGTTTRIATRVAADVRTRQRAGVIVGVVAGLLLGAGWVAAQLRANPRLRAAPEGRVGPGRQDDGR